MTNLCEHDGNLERAFVRVAIGAFCLVIAAWKITEYGQIYCPPWLIALLMGGIPPLILTQYNACQMRSMRTHGLSADRPEEALNAFLGGMDGCEWIFYAFVSALSLWVGIVIHTIVNDEWITGLLMSVILCASTTGYTMLLLSICRWWNKQKLLP